MSNDDIAVDDAVAADSEQSEEQAAKDKLKEAIDVKVEEVGPLRKKLTITVPRELIDERVSEQFDELRSDATIPGFRRGRAPLKLIEKRFGGEVGEQVGSNLIGGSYMAAVEKESLDPLGDPMVNVYVREERTDDKGGVKLADVEKLVPVDEALEHIKLPKEGPLTYSCEVEIRPEFELPELDGISVEKPVVKVTKTDVDQELRRILALRGTFRPVEKGKSKKDDIIVGNVRISVDGEVVKTEENAQLAVRDQKYDGVLLEGFEDAGKGKTCGDKISLDVIIPEDDDNVDIRGKSAKWEIEVLELKRLEIPKLTDELLGSMGFDSEDELRELVKENMESEISQALRSGLHKQIGDYLLEHTKFDVPEGLSQRQTERTVALRMMELYRSGQPEAEIMKQVDEIRLQAQGEARDYLRLFFILDKIAEKLEIDVTEEELNSAIAQIAHRRNRRFDRVRDELISKNHLNTLYIRIRDEKIMDELLENANVTEKEVPRKSAGATKKSATKKKSASGKKAAEKKKGDDS